VGQTLAVGSELIRIEVAGEAEAATAKAMAVGAVAQAAAGPHTSPLPRAGEGAARPEADRASPRAGEEAAPAAVERKFPLPRAGEGQGEGGGVAIEDRPIASPALRRRAWELGVDLHDVRPSGLAGRIVQADLDRHVEQGGRRAPAGTPEPAARARTATPRTDEQSIKIIGLRRKIAQKMQDAKRRIPHFTYVEEVDVTEVEALRNRLNDKWSKQRPKLTLLPFLVRAVVIAVREFPQVNARFDDEAGVVTRHGAVHVGIATQTEAGLMVPVLRHAEARDLWDSAAEIARLADTARGGRATRDELSGSTITITSLGALGGIVSTPVINHPEVAIVGVNRIAERPVMRGGAVVGRQIMNLSSSFDHRVVDGVDAARFVQALKGLLEAPAMLFTEE
jgi:2-oxoisovalerate dehydrogenase E2 component (dihydrolipoyl transacylase)